MGVIRHCCSRCRGTLEEIEVPIAVSSNGYTPKKKRAPSAFGLFLKQKSQQVRNKPMLEMPSVSQSQVMAECGRLWSLEKKSKNEATAANNDALLENLNRMTVQDTDA